MPGGVAADATVNEALTALVKSGWVAINVFGPIKLTLKLLNVARPLASVTFVNVPLNAPEPLFRLTMISTPAARTLLLELSCNCTVTAGAMAAFAMTAVGCCTNTSLLVNSPTAKSPKSFKPIT